MFDPLSKHTYVSEPFRFVSSIFPPIIYYNYKGSENNEPMNTACRIPAVIPWISTNESCLIKYHNPCSLALLNDRIQSYSMDFCHHSHDIIFHPPWTRAMPIQQITTKRPSNKSTQIMMTHENWYCISWLALNSMRWTLSQFEHQNMFADFPNYLTGQKIPFIFSIQFSNVFGVQLISLDLEKRTKTTHKKQQEPTIDRNHSFSECWLGRGHI